MILRRLATSIPSRPNYTPRLAQELVDRNKPLAKVFSYDAALILREVLEPAVKPVTDKVAAIFRLCTGDLPGDSDAVARIGIAPAFRGCGARVDAIELQTDAAFYSTWASPNKRMCSLFDSRGGLDAQCLGKQVPSVHSSAYLPQG